jgi:hypothetical protein
MALIEHPIRGAVQQCFFYITSPQSPLNLTPPSPTGRGRKYGEKMVIERGFTKYKFLLPFSDRRRGRGKRLKQLKDVSVSYSAIPAIIYRYCFIPFSNSGIWFNL